jgi:predicted DNA-binding WGR domain protein
MFAHIDAQNRILGFYDPEIHTSIPETFIEITREQWQVALRNNHNKVNSDGTTEIFDFRSEAEKAQQAKNKKIAELKAKLAESDFKAMPDYDQDNTAILAERQAWREEVRKLEDGE